MESNKNEKDEKKKREMEADCLSLESSSLVASWEGGGYLGAIDTILTLCALVIRHA